jgi:hypothetical protein
MSTFSEMPAQLEMLGAALHAAIVQAGFPLVQALLLPMNLSSAWLEKAKPMLKELVRQGYATNDPYASQNLMESFVSFNRFTERVGEIRCPTLILNGEFDYLTPRECHEILRRNITNSRLMIFPRGFHAFTLENPPLTMRVIEGFIRCVRDGVWRGDQSVWVAAEDPQTELYATRCIGDHMRAVFLGPVPVPDASGRIAEEWRVPLPGMPRATPTPPRKQTRKPRRVAAPVGKKARQPS